MKNHNLGEYVWVTCSKHRRVSKSKQLMDVFGISGGENGSEELVTIVSKGA